MKIVLTIEADTASELNEAISGLHSQMYQNQSIMSDPPTWEDKSDEVKPEPVKRTRSKAEKQQDLVKEPEPEVIAPKTDVYSIEDIREMLREISQSGKRTEAKDLLTKFGASKLPALDVSKYDDFVTELKKL